MQELIDKGYSHCGDEICSNFDHEINEELAERMKKEKIVADYPGWNFYGTVWYENGKYNCAVMRYRFLQEIISNETFEELKKEVCDKYGND